MPSEPKHRQIHRELLAEIASGKYGPSGRLPSEAQLVKRFTASRPTVARALRDLQEQGLIVRRPGSGSYVAGRGAVPAKTLRQLGLLIPGLGTTEFFEAICGELAGLARVQEYGLLWGGGAFAETGADTSIEGAEDLCEQFIRREVAGVFFAPTEHSARKEEINRRLTERLQNAGIAVVLLDRDLGAFPRRSEFDLVGVDNFAGGYALAEHLLKLGCRRLVYATRPLSATVTARIAGAREALLDHGVAIPPNFVRVGEPVELDLLHDPHGEERIDAILTANDQYAAELLRILERRGLRVPRDVRLVGFDDVRYASYLSVPLTTMRQPCREIASTAFRAMLERIGDPALPPKSLTLSPRLVIRESCGAYTPRDSG